MKTSWKLGLLGTTVLAVAALSSYATQHVAAMLGHHPALGVPVFAGLYEPWSWLTWQRESWAHAVRRAFLWPDIGAGVAVLGLFGAAAVRNLRSSTTRQPKPQDAHGSAAWATREDIEAMGLLGNTEGIYIGAWQEPGAKVVHYLRDKSGVHLGGIAPTRSGKGLGWVLPNLWSVLDSMFIYDPKGELWQLTAGWRKSIGQNVLLWQPASSDMTCGFNFLDEVRLNTDYEVADAQNIAHLIVDPDGAGFSTHWDKAAFGFLTGLLLHCLHVAHDTGTRASLPTVATLLSSPKVPPLALCQAMAGSKYAAAIAAAGVDQISRDDRERGAVLSTVKTYLSLFLDPIIARNTSYSSFRIRDLMDHKRPTSLYIAVTAVDSARMRPLVRLLITMMLNQTVGVPVQFDDVQQPLPSHRHNMVLLMDEFPDLRRMKMFEQAMAVMSGAGLTAFLIMQDREQLLGAYGQHQTVTSNIHMVGAYAPNEGKTADWLSHELGNQTINVEQYSTSWQRGSWKKNISHSVHPVSRALLTSDEVKRLEGPIKRGKMIVKAGKMLLLPTGQRPIMGRQILYFEDAVFLARSKILSPDCSDDLEMYRRFKTINESVVT